MKAVFVAGAIGLASTCLAFAIYMGAVSPSELKPANLFTPAKAMEKGSPGPSTGKHIGQPKYEDVKKTTKPKTGSTSGSSPTKLQK